jgi:hypothetical protein
MPPLGHKAFPDWLRIAFIGVGVIARATRVVLSNCGPSEVIGPATGRFSVAHFRRAERLCNS